MAEDLAVARRIPSFCHLCGRRLAGRYYRHSNGLVFCAACHDSRPRCARCAAPLDDAALADLRAHPSDAESSPLCRRCARTAPRCAACRRPIAGSWYTFEELIPPPVARRFCERCVQTRPRCDLCRVPVGPATAPLDDGQFRCEHCAADLVLGDRPVAAVYRDALASFARAVGSAPRDVPAVEVVTRLRMGEVRRAVEQSPALLERSGAGHHVLGFFVRAHGASTIYVERALPHSLLLGTLAHELGHAWQAEHAPALRDPLLCEGFAEWCAYTVLMRTGLHAMAERAARRDDLYGRGLRHFQQIERTRGLPGVLATARGAAAR